MLRSGPRPVGKGAVGGEDRAFDLFGAGFGDLRDDLAGGRVEDRFDEALACDEFTIDQQRGEQRGRMRTSHFASSLFLCGHGASLAAGVRPFSCGWKETSGRSRGRQILNTESGVRLNRWLAPASRLFAGDGQERVDQRRPGSAATPGQADVEGVVQVGDRPCLDDVALQ